MGKQGSKGCCAARTWQFRSMGSHVSSNSVSVCSQEKYLDIIQQSQCLTGEAQSAKRATQEHAPCAAQKERMCGGCLTRPSSGRFLYGANRDTGRPSSLQHPSTQDKHEYIKYGRHCKPWHAPLWLPQGTSLLSRLLLAWQLILEEAAG